MLRQRSRALAIVAAVACLLAAAYALHRSEYQAAVLLVVAAALGGLTVATLNRK